MHKKRDFDYWLSIKDDCQRKLSIIHSWEQGRQVQGELAIWARYYYWWAVLVEFVYSQKNLEYEWHESTQTKNFFAHITKLLREGRALELQNASKI